MPVIDQQGLARHLGVTDRRIRQLEVEQVIDRLDGKPVRYDLSACSRRYRLYAEHDVDAVCRQIEEAAKSIDAMFERMRQEPDVQKRREIAKQDGSAIGRLDTAMKLATALTPEHGREMARTFNNLVVGRAAGDFFEFCNWRFADTPHENVAVHEPGIGTGRT